MNERSHNLKKIRPQIVAAKISDDISNEERFQNATLRPILKFQNDLFLLLFQDYIIRRKNVFYQLTLEKRLDYINNSVKKDLNFQNSLKGIVVGHFTIEEYKIYATNASKLNKRMMTMLIKRIQDQIQFFEKDKLI